MRYCKISLENIKKIRKLKKMTQLELANKIGVTQSTISKIENDVRNKETPSVRLDLIEKISNILGVCPLDLITCNKKIMCNKDCSNCSRKILFKDKK